MPVMAAAARAGWKTRLNKLLDLSTTAIRYRVQKFRNLRGAHFEEALLLGFGRGKTLQMSVEADRLAIHIDEREQAVEVHIGGGILRKVGGVTSIPASGYRIQLPGVTPKQAIERMLGMVVRR